MNTFKIGDPVQISSPVYPEYKHGIVKTQINNVILVIVGENELTIPLYQHELKPS